MRFMVEGFCVVSTEPRMSHSVRRPLELAAEDQKNKTQHSRGSLHFHSF